MKAASLNRLGNAAEHKNAASKQGEMPRPDFSRAGACGGAADALQLGRVRTLGGAAGRLTEGLVDLLGEGLLLHLQHQVDDGHVRRRHPQRDACTATATGSCTLHRQRVVSSRGHCAFAAAGEHFPGEGCRRQHDRRSTSTGGDRACIQSANTGWLAGWELDSICHGSAAPLSLPLSWGRTRATALAAPVVVGTMLRAAARARRRSRWEASSSRWSPV